MQGSVGGLHNGKHRSFLKLHNNCTSRNKSRSSSARCTPKWCTTEQKRTVLVAELTAGQLLKKKAYWYQGFMAAALLKVQSRIRVYILEKISKHYLMGWEHESVSFGYVRRQVFVDANARPKTHFRIRVHSLLFFDARTMERVTANGNWACAECFCTKRWPFVGTVSADTSWVRAFTDLAKKHFRVKAVLKAGSFRDNITCRCDGHVQCVHRYNPTGNCIDKKATLPPLFKTPAMQCTVVRWP